MAEPLRVRADPDDARRDGDRRAVLATRGLAVRFGGLRAVDGVDLEAGQGEVLGVIGPNGAGKTTLFDAITGLVRPEAGRILLRGRDVTSRPAWRRAALGLGRTFQNLRLFEEMTVFQNVLAGRYRRSRSSPLAQLVALPGAREEERAARELAAAEVEFLGLSGRADVPVKHLPYGHRRRVEIARALATEPSLLLLDEPAAGMNARESEELIALIGEIRDRGVTVVLVEHHMRVVMAISDRIAVLHHGAVIADGAPREIRADERVVEAYLGSRGGHA